MRLSKCMKRILATLLTVAILGEQVSVISWAQEPSIESETAAIQEIEESTEETVTENEVEIVTEEECEVETEIETEVEAESETETETEIEVEVLEEVTEPDTKQEYIYSDDNVTVKATLQYADAIPDEAEFRVTAVTSSTEGYNYDAYMDALNEHSEDISASSSMEGVDRNAEYTEDNTLLYDIAFMVDKVDEDGNVIPGEKVEYQPAEGSVTFSFTFASKQLENEIEAECDEAITVVHLPLEESIKQSVDSTEQATDISAENLEIEIVDAVVSLNRTADEVEFCLEDLSLVAFVGVTGQELNPGTARNYQSILENAVYYGILSNQINKTGHMDTNFATKYLTGSGNVTAGAYTGDNAGDFIIAHKDSQSFFIDGKAVNVWCTEDISNTITITNNSSKLFTTRAALEAYIDDMMDHVIDQSIAMAEEHTYVVERVPDQNNADIDLTGRPDGTYYISLIELLNNSQNGAIKIKKRSTQTVVFNYTGTTGIALKRFSVWNVDVENGYQSSATSSGAIDVTARTIVFNMPNVTSFRNEGGICGIVIAPKATYDIGSTSSGWLVTDVMASSGGEWHNVWGEMPIHSEIPAPIELSAMKYVDGREPVGDTEIFTFVLEKGVQDSQGNWTWTTLETVQNKGSVIEFSKINFENEGDYYYRISESPAQNGGYRYDAHKYIAKVSVAKTNSISGSTTRCYVDDVNYYLANDVSEISTSNAAQNVIFHNYEVDTISIQVKKTWRDSENNDGKRPDFVEVELYGNGEKVGDPVVLNADNNWSYQWDNLLTSENNQIIDYTVREKNVPNGYTSTVVGTMENGFEVINSHSKEKITVSGTKEWNDQNNRDGIRPEKITVNLYADGVYVRSQDITPNANGQWNYTFEYLDKYKAGKEIVYTVTEEKVEGYTTQIQGYNITNSHDIEEMDVSVEKVWFDQDDDANHRPTSIQVQIYADGTAYGQPVTLNDNNAWRYVWNNLPVYKVGEEGVRIQYTVDELNVSAAYTKIVTGGVTNGFVITNVHNVDLTEISVNKVWADNNNNDGIRPREILVQLYADEVESGQPQRLNAANGWSYSWEVYEKDKNGKDIHYTVKELNVPEGYTSVITGSETDGYTITNSHTPEKTQINATKVWMDDNNLYQMRPTSIRLQLYADGELCGEPVTVKANSEDISSPWTYQWVNLPKYSKGKEIQYTVKEMDIPYQYTSSIDGDMVNGYVITNAYKRETVELSVKKVWNDNENQDGIRPTKVFARLHTTSPNQMTLATVELDSKNNWSYTWIGLPKYYQNTEVQYTITEVFESAAVQEEYTSVVSKEENVFVITNSHVPKTTEVSVSKIWNDGENQDGLRPASVKVNLFADGKPKGQTVLLNADNQWSYVWENLPEREQGKEIVYTVQEESIPTGYISTISKNASDGYTITNFHKVETFDLPVTKVWYDNNNQDGIRPVSIGVQLLANGVPYGSEVTLSETNNWNYVWNNLPKYSNGKLITYSVEELGVPAKYTSIISGGTENGFVITNSYHTEVTEISVRKAWEDENNTDQLRPKSVKVQLYGDGEPVGNPIVLDNVNNWTYRWEELAKNDAGKKISYTVEELEVPYGYTASVTENATGGFVITNRHQVEKTEVSVSKVWEDRNDTHDIRPESIQVQLYADGEAEGAPVTLSGSNGWSYKWNNLPKNKARRSIQYTVAEVNVPEGYSSVVSGGMVNGYVITNTCDHLEMIEIPVKKVWNDENNQDGLRPGSIQVQLYADGVAEGSPVTLNEKNQWSYKWEKLEKNSTGALIVYTVAEVDVPAGYKYVVTGDNIHGYVITNSHAPITTEVSVSKIWNDGENQDGLRPASVKVNLLADGKPKGQTVLLNADNQWSYVWENLPEREQGKEIVYTVQEESIPTGYISTISKNASDGYTITNFHKVETFDLPVTKVWYDNNDQDGIRPESIVVKLFANGTPYGSEVTLSETNNWNYVWNNLPKYSNGKLITYSVEELGVPAKYTSVISGGIENGFVITNSYHTEVTEISVRKVWEDENNTDQLRPKSVKVQLYGDGEPVGNPIVLDEVNNWTYRWEELAKNDAGKKISYTVEELEVPYGYTASVTGNATGGFVITNRHQVEKTEVSVKKVWEDRNDTHDIRPESIQVQLYADGVAEGKPVTLSVTNGWSYKWNNLPKNKARRNIQYTVAEVNVPEGYSSVVSGGMVNGYVITNTCDHLEMIEIPVKKVWNDENNQDGLRPGSIQVQLYADGVAEGNPVTLNEQNQWSYKWEKLEKNSTGALIVYTVAEVDVPAGYKYVVTGDNIHGYVITNTHKPEETQVSVSKIWNDGNDQDKLRSASVKVNLLADGKPTEKSVQLTETTGWSHTWNNLPVKKAGKLIEYTVEEEGVAEGYTSVIRKTAENVYEITNTHEPEVINIPVKKVWYDNNNALGLRSSSIAVQLYANGSASGKPVVLNADNQWSHTWENMPRFSNGEMITYSVSEVQIPNGYGCVVTGGTENGFVVTNYIDATQIVNIPVSKVWVDDNNRDGIRPKYVKVQLYGDDKAIGEPVILDERNGWTYTWEELKYSTGGTEIVYEVKEEPVDGYTTSITKNSTGEYVITNSHEVETINLPVKKVWFDKDDTHKIRPTSIKVQLYANGVEFGNEIELNGASSNPWSYTWTNLKKNEAGKPIVYTIKEVSVPSGYTSVVTGGTENGFTITNTCDHLEMIEIPVKKVWDDGNNQDGLRPESIQVQLYADGDPEGSPVILNEKNQWSYKWEKLEKNANGTLVVYTVKEVGVPAGYKYVVTGDNVHGYVITNRHKPETVNIPVKKVWFDKDDIHNSRPEYIEVQLYANGKASGTPVVLNANNQWSHTWNDMARFSNGKMIAYSVEESKVPSGYTSVVAGGTENGFIITNNCNHLEMTEIEVSKKWVDSNNQDGIRPESVKVQLYGDDVAIGESIILDERNQWTYTWEELKYSDEHKEIKYTVKEEPVAGYQSTITGTAAEGYVITNSHEVETINIPVKKVWYDGNTQGNRPQSVTVELYADGVKFGSEIELKGKDNWSHLWANLPKNKAGKPIVYTIKEINVPAGYTSVVSGGVQNGFIVTNTLDESEIIEISVHKIWDDANNREGMRPKEIQVQLYADGVKEGATIVLSDSNQWSYKWELLKKNNNGDLIEYTVKEANVPNGYLSSVEGEMATGYTITNHISEVDIQKIDKSTGKGLEGATLQVIDQDGQVVHEWTSTKYTKLIRGLLIGKEYVLREKATPQGYHSTDDILFMIDENGNIITEAGNLSQEGVLLIKNERIIIPSDSDDEPDESEEPEDTEETEEIQENRIAVEMGDSANIVATCLAFIGSLLGLILITFEKKKKKS